MSKDKQLHVLIVDDNKNNLFTLQTLIKEHIDAQIFQALSGPSALQLLLQENIDLIILDVQMPEMDGFETAKLIRSRKKTKHIPIVFLTAAYKSEEFKQKGFAIGAADYLTKPIDTTQLISRLRSYIRFIEQERLHNQELERKVQERTVELVGANQKLKQEILERKQIEEKLQEARDQLEQRVEERTAELSSTNQQLKTEINERKLVEAALERLSRQTQLILESAGEGIFGINLQGNTILINPAAAKMLGYQVDELIGRRQHNIIHHTKKDGMSYPIEECPIEAALLDGNTYHRDDEVFWRKDGSSFFVEYMTTPIIEEGQITGAVVTFSDISERKEAEATLLEAKNAAENAKVVAENAKITAEAANLSKSQFLANMSHELRTPLNAIIGYSEMLQEEAEDLEQDDFMPDLLRIHSAGKHLLGLINDVLDLSKIEAGKMELHLETFDLEIAFNEVVNTVQPLMEKKDNTLKVLGNDELGKMYADMTKLRQILLNLLGNASKFTEKGLICIEVSRQVEDDEDWFRFCITDDGIGMTSAQQQKLFQPFTQADPSTTRKYGGTGLGLTITKEFTEMMGGNITVVSEFGHGSMFTILLPAIAREPTIQSTEEILLEEGEGIVLVIDDDSIVRQLLKDYMTQLGYAVAIAGGGKEGLRLARKLRPDAIILDVKMQGIDGWDVLSKLKSDSLLSDIPVIMMSVEDEQLKGYALGATDYLIKPVHHEQLVDILGRYNIGDESQGLVMVVEDDLVISEVMAEMIKKSGWRVFKAENGKVALEHLDNKKPALILLDLMMPVMNGFEFLSQLRANEKWQSIPVVVLTSTHLSPEEQARLYNDVDTIYQKETYNRDDLLLHIHKLIAASKPEVKNDEIIYDDNFVQEL
ncbi:response regulator [Candidatus Parabeggiatoa sp. HSG14]|uniref:response regulator n=1 Tax=Candidatus Parabeggiatoa sp. HSG14 TaxID=3055593 RepID=UPI0025A84A29|nr:response regulator [Thiotrichales bacterium HSG14]